MLYKTKCTKKVEDIEHNFVPLLQIVYINVCSVCVISRPE